MQHLQKSGGGVIFPISERVEHTNVQTCNVPACFRSILFPFTLLRTLLHFFAFSKNSTHLFSSSSALFAKNHPGGGWRCFVRALRASRRGIMLTSRTGAIPSLDRGQDAAIGSDVPVRHARRIERKSGIAVAVEEDEAPWHACVWRGGGPLRGRLARRSRSRKNCLRTSIPPGGYDVRRLFPAISFVDDSTEEPL